MVKLFNRAGFAATVLGAALLLDLALIRFSFTADLDSVYVLGHRINYTCAARQRFGAPCPTCGFTRGFVLSLHGRIPDAWRLSPAGPLAAIGTLGMAVVLLAYAIFEQRRPSTQVASVKRWIEAGALSYGAVATLIWISSWISTVAKLK